MNETIPDGTMDEILAGAGEVENKAETAIAFLDEWSTWIAELINLFKDFFAKISEAFSTEE